MKIGPRLNMTFINYTKLIGNDASRYFSSESDESHAD